MLTFRKYCIGNEDDDNKKIGINKVLQESIFY